MKNLFNNQENLSTRPSLKLRFGLVVMSVICFAFGTVFSLFFKIKLIESNLPLNTSIQEKLLFRNLFFVNQKEVKQLIKTQHPEYKPITVKKVVPNKLYVYLKKEQVVAQLKNNGSYILLNSAGKVIEQRKNNTPFLPTIRYFQILRAFESKPGIHLKKQEINYALALLAKKENFPVKLNNIQINKPNQLQITGSDDSPKITLSTRKQIDKNAIILHNIVKSLDIKGIKPSEINLLFDIPSFIL